MALRHSTHRPQRATELAAILQSSIWFERVLRTVRAVGKSECWVGAGADRDLVWDSRYGSGFEPSRVKDVDVVYFDAEDLRTDTERTVEHQLRAVLPEVPWEVANQAAVHLWYPQRFGVTVPPLTSLVDAVGTWPEYATAVAVRISRSGFLDVVAPFGLDDLLDGIWRWNPRRATLDEALSRLRRKSVPVRWPGVSVDGPLTRVEQRTRTR